MMSSRGAGMASSVDGASMSVTILRAAPTILDRCDLGLIVASRPEQAGLLAAMAAAPDPGWRAVYADADDLVLAR
jgi:hypothetical protein